MQVRRKARGETSLHVPRPVLQARGETSLHVPRPVRQARRRHDPCRRRRPYTLRSRVDLESGQDLGSHHLAQLGRRVGERALDRSELHHEIDCVIDVAGASHRHLDVDTAHLHVAEAGLFQDAARAVAVGQCERSGSVRGDGRLDGHVLARRHERHEHPRILRQRLPAHERNATLVAQRGAHVAERGGRILEEHHAEAREENVELALESVHLRVVAKERDVAGAGLSRAAAGALEHRLRNVDADNPAAASDARGKLERRGAAAAPDVEHRMAEARRGGIDCQRRDFFELPVEHLLTPHPARSGNRVPESDLFDIGPVGFVRHAISICCCNYPSTRSSALSRMSVLRMAGSTMAALSRPRG